MADTWTQSLPPKSRKEPQVCDSKPLFGEILPIHERSCVDLQIYRHLASRTGYSPVDPKQMGPTSSDQSSPRSQGLLHFDFLQIWKIGSKFLRMDFISRIVRDFFYDIGKNVTIQTKKSSRKL